MRGVEMETDAIMALILSFRAPCGEAGKYGSTLTFEEWDAAYNQFTALETERRSFVERDAKIREKIQEAKTFVGAAGSSRLNEALDLLGGDEDGD